MAQLKRRPSLDRLEELIGIRFADRNRLERAFTHSSVRGGGEGPSYERLEFLGDRVLGLAVAERLFQLYPKAAEGDLSVRLNRLVSAEICAEIADEVGLSDFIRFGADLRNVSAERTRNMRADVVESLIAAIYLEHGLEEARRFVLRHWEERLGEASAARRDPKTELQEWSHKRSGAPPRYELVSREGPDHDPRFTVRASLPDLAPAEGSGRSKRAAEQVAAEALLRREGVWSADD